MTIMKEMCDRRLASGTEELFDWISKANIPDSEQAKELAAFMHMSADDVFFDIWGKFSLQQVYVMHPLVFDELMARLRK